MTRIVLPEDFLADRQPLMNETNKSLLIAVLSLQAHKYSSTVQPKEAGQRRPPLFTRSPGGCVAPPTRADIKDSLQRRRTRLRRGVPMPGNIIRHEESSALYSPSPPPPPLSLCLPLWWLPVPRGVWEWFGVFDRLNLAYWCKLHSIHNRHRDTLSVWL